jgi:hypothetical protein
MRAGLLAGAALFLVLAVPAFYLLFYGNIGSALYNGCFHPYAALRPVGDGNPHFQGFPPRFVCLYRTKDGRLVERPD